VDISQAAVRHASMKYPRENLEYRLGSCANMPVDDGSVDLVVSFETIEHHDEHEAMMSEIRRVLRPGGVLVISSPDKFEYSEKPGYANPFHVKELYREEFQELLVSNFANVRLYGQRVLLGSALFAQDSAEALAFQEMGDDTKSSDNLPSALYWVAVASNADLPSTRGGIFEQPMSDIWRDIDAQRNPLISTIVNIVAKPDSRVLEDKVRGKWYFENNQDLIGAGVDPLIHWKTCGVDEGRLPASDLTALISELLAEREASLHLSLEFMDAQLSREREDGRVRQGAFEAEVSELRLNVRDAVEKGLHALAERERDFSKQLAALHENLDGERVNRFEVLRQHKQREEELLAEIKAVQAEFRQAERQFHDSRSKVEAELERVNLQAQRDVQEHLRVLADRERSIGEQLVQRQKEFGQLLEKQIESARCQLDALGAQHSGREDSLRQEIGAAQVRLLQAEQAFEKHREILEAEVARVKLQTRGEMEAMARLHEENLKNLDTQREAEAQMILTLESELNRVQRDWTWRLTAPLRTCAKFFRSR
jgi:SAM-dependent methyltransferase